MLQIDDLYATYGAIKALNGVRLHASEGELVSIVGPNGAGKTTLFKVISGVLAPTAGRIEFDGINLLKINPADRPHLGIAHVPEGRQVFKNMTVFENLEMGSYSNKGKWRSALDRIYALFPILVQRKDQLAGTLSGGEQQMLAIGRALASSPRLLLLDEPSMGLAPAVADLIFERIEEIHKQDRTTIILVEQRAAEALQSCDRGYVLDVGCIVLSGPPDLLMRNDRVRKAYFGL